MEMIKKPASFNFSNFIKLENLKNLKALTALILGSVSIFFTMNATYAAIYIAALVISLFFSSQNVMKGLLLGQAAYAVSTLWKISITSDISSVAVIAALSGLASYLILQPERDFGLEVLGAALYLFLDFGTVYTWVSLVFIGAVYLFISKKANIAAATIFVAISSALVFAYTLGTENQEYQEVANQLNNASVYIYMMLSSVNMIFVFYATMPYFYDMTGADKKVKEEAEPTEKEAEAEVEDKKEETPNAKEKTFTEKAKHVAWLIGCKGAIALTQTIICGTLVFFLVQ